MQRPTTPEPNYAGVTMMELLVVMAIASIVALLATPSLRSFIKRSELQSLSNDFVNSLQMARAEAVNRNTCTTICKSASTSSGTVKCEPDASGTYDADDWHMGWVVYLNPTCNRVAVTNTHPADQGNILFVQQPQSTNYTLVSPNSRKSITFGPQGNIPIGSAGKFTLRDSSDSTNPLNRSICIDVMGRVRVISEADSCS